MREVPWWAGCMALAMLSCRPPGPRPPLEESGYARITSAAEIGTYLEALSRRFDEAEHLVLGYSAGGRALDALLVSRDVAALRRAEAPAGRATVLLVGSQHGTESSGAEAILLVARDLLSGPLAPLLEDMDFILLPDANPDGRETHRRTNADGINLSTNFVALTEPETRAIVDLLAKWKPAIVLDAHESAILKKHSLALQGYVTDFQAQFEIANNPNVDAGIQALSRERLRPEVVERVRAGGLAAQSYVGEITDIHQPITHGGLSLGNLRNRAGMTGAVSFLVENRLDRADGVYATPRNIRKRVRKQYLSITAFLATCHDHEAEILAATTAARRRWRDAGPLPPVELVSQYAADPRRPYISITLRRLDDGRPETLRFDYHGRVENRYPLPVPLAYVVRAHRDAMRSYLDRQHVRYEVVTSAQRRSAVVQHIVSRQHVPGKHGWGSYRTALDERRAQIAIEPGDLWIDLRQPARRMIPLLLDPRSNSSIFETPDFAPFAVPGQDFFVSRIESAPVEPSTSSG
jgi:hypothetical protein